METRYLEIAARSTTGKGEAGRIRRNQGVIPAVFYGAKTKAVSVSVNPKELLKAIDTEAGINTLLTLKAKDLPQLDKKVVILKDKQLHPITKNLVHVDFYEIDMSRKIEVQVPVICIGKPVGLENGGILQIVQRVITVECLPTNIPEKIEIDVAPLDIGDAIHIKDITPPTGTEFKFDTNFTIVTVATPMKEEVAAAPAAEVAAEGAVPGAEGAAPQAEGAAQAAAPGKEGDKAPAADKAKTAPAQAKAPDKGKEKK